MNREEALQKIKKCMALGKSAEPHEAAAALRQAQKLMERFGLSTSDISLTDVSEEPTRSASAGSAAWEVRLAQIVGNAFGCELYMWSKRERECGNWRIKNTLSYVFVGIETAPVMAAYAHDVLARQCARARTAHIKKQPRNCTASTKTARGDAFALGWVAAAAGVVGCFAQPEQNKKLILEYMDKHHAAMPTAKVRNTTKGHPVNGHHMAGYEQGQNASLHRGVNARQQQKQLTGTASSL